MLSPSRLRVLQLPAQARFLHVDSKRVVQILATQVNESNGTKRFSSVEEGDEERSEDRKGWEEATFHVHSARAWAF